MVSMGRAWTGRFFNWRTAATQQDQQRTFHRTYEGFVSMAGASQPSRLVGDGWRTSPTKVLDNAIIGYTMVTI